MTCPRFNNNEATEFIVLYNVIHNVLINLENM